MIKYKVNITDKPGKPFNPMHEIVDGREGVVLEANIGERGWFTYKIDEDGWSPWHRVHTSEIQNVTEKEDEIILETENTFYTFTKVK